MTSLDDTIPGEDHGADTAFRYGFQDLLAVPLCAELAHGQTDMVAIYPEFVEDIAVEHETWWRFIQVKSHQENRPPWTLTELIEAGALSSLWRAHETVGETAVERGIPYQLGVWVSGPLKASKTKGRRDLVHVLAAHGEGGRLVDRDRWLQRIQSRFDDCSEGEAAELIEALVANLSGRVKVGDAGAKRTLAEDEVRILVSLCWVEDKPPLDGIEAAAKLGLHEQIPDLNIDEFNRVFDRLLARIKRAASAAGERSQHARLFATVVHGLEIDDGRRLQAEAKRLSREVVTQLLQPLTRARDATGRSTADPEHSHRDLILVTRVLDPPDGEGLSSTTVWLGATGRTAVVVDAVKVTHRTGGALSMSTGALLPDASYSFAFQYGSSSVHALRPALALNPADEEEVSFTLGLAPEGSFPSTGGSVRVELQYHSLTGFHGELPLRSHDPSHAWLAALLDTDVEHDGCVLEAGGVQVGYLSHKETSSKLVFSALSREVWPIGQYELERAGPLPTANTPVALPPARERMNARIVELDAVEAVCTELARGRDWAYDLAAGLREDRCRAALVERAGRAETFAPAMVALSIRHMLTPDATLADVLLEVHDAKDVQALTWNYNPLTVLAMYPAGDWWTALLTLANRDLHEALLSLYARRASLTEAQADALEEQCWRDIATEHPGYSNPSTAALRYLMWRGRSTSQIEDKLLARYRHLLPLVQES